MTCYATKLLDCPWPERGGGKIKRGADRHYGLVKVRDLPALILGSGVWNPAKDAHCYLWATNTHLMDGGWLMGVLGFRYITTITWPKPHIGLGQYFRGQSEHLLFGVRGKGLRLRREHTERRDISTLLPSEATGVHSKKPTSAYELIEAASPGPRIEFFARAAREGWDAWGNEGIGEPT